MENGSRVNTPPTYHARYALLSETSTRLLICCAKISILHADLPGIKAVAHEFFGRSSYFVVVYPLQNRGV